MFEAIVLFGAALVMGASATFFVLYDRAGMARKCDESLVRERDKRFALFCAKVMRLYELAGPGSPDVLDPEVREIFELCLQAGAAADKGDRGKAFDLIARGDKLAGHLLENPPPTLATVGSPATTGKLKEQWTVPESG